MVAIARLTPEMIRERFDTGAYQRGSAYYRDGHIINTIRTGDVLHAKCIGSDYEPYELEAALGRNGLASAWCSCPVGDTGGCKHVVALLLTWIRHPERFLASEEVATVLRSLAKDELELLVYLMLQKQPELSALVQRPFLQMGASPSLDSAMVRQIVAKTFEATSPADWGSYDGPPDNIMILITVAERRLQTGDWQNAEHALRLICKRVMAYRFSLDVHGNFTAVVSACIPGLISCLERSTGTLRQDLVSLLMELSVWDTQNGFGRVASHIGSELIEHATADEQLRLAAWAKEQFETDDITWRARSIQRTFGDLLLKLGEEKLDDETFLAICRALGETALLVGRLLSLDRVDEALKAIPYVSHQSIFEVADLFLNSGHIQEIEELLLAADHTSGGFSFTNWLRLRAEERGDPEHALELAEAAFWGSPTIASLQDVKRLAQELGRWHTMRPILCSRLADEGRLVLLTEIYLGEGEAGLALAALDQVPPEQEGSRVHDLRLQAARAGEKTHPQEALLLYAEEVEILIAARGRENYHTAAQYLSRMKLLYERMDLQDAWKDLIEGLRADNYRLWALREELQREGL